MNFQRKSAGKNINDQLSTKRFFKIIPCNPTCCRADQSRRARRGFQRTETEKSCTSLTIHNRYRNLQTTAYFSWFLMHMISYLHHAFEFVKSWTMLGYPLGKSESKQKEREGEKIMNRQRTSRGYGSFAWQQFWNKARVFPPQI